MYIYIYIYIEGERVQISDRIEVGSTKYCYFCSFLLTHNNT